MRSRNGATLSESRTSDKLDFQRDIFKSAWALTYLKHWMASYAICYAGLSNIATNDSIWRIRIWGLLIQGKKFKSTSWIPTAILFHRASQPLCNELKRNSGRFQIFDDLFPLITFDSNCVRLRFHWFVTISYMHSTIVRLIWCWIRVWSWQILLFLLKSLL